MSLTNQSNTGSSNLVWCQMDAIAPSDIIGRWGDGLPRFGGLSNGGQDGFGEAVVMGLNQDGGEGVEGEGKRGGQRAKGGRGGR